MAGVAPVWLGHVVCGGARVCHAVADGVRACCGGTAPTQSRVILASYCHGYGWQYGRRSYQLVDGSWRTAGMAGIAALAGGRWQQPFALWPPPQPGAACRPRMAASLGGQDLFAELVAGGGGPFMCRGRVGTAAVLAVRVVYGCGEVFALFSHDQCDRLGVVRCAGLRQAAWAVVWSALAVAHSNSRSLLAGLVTRGGLSGRLSKIAPGAGHAGLCDHALQCGAVAHGQGCFKFFHRMTQVTGLP